MNVLVTGGLGYIGSHTVVELYKAGYTVVIIDDLSNSNIKVLEKLEQIVGKKILFFNINILNKEKLFMIQSEEKIDSVIHFAAKKSIPESITEPLYYYQNNITGLLNILEYCQYAGVENFVFSSSCTIYGEPVSLPISENAPIQLPLSPYGNSKLIGEQILKEYSALKNSLKIVLLRYFNPVGAHNSSLIGELPNGVPGNLMPYITQTAAGWRKELQIFGNDYETDDGTAIRDFIHVVDLSIAHVKALAWLHHLQKQLTNAEIFNIGTGRGYSVLEVVKSFEKQTGISLPYKFASRRKGDICKIWANPEKARNILDWKAVHDLDDMTLSAWKWQQTLKMQV